ncbi:MAG: response regulator transcription factor [Streptosporangiaceae bacterium]
MCLGLLFPQVSGRLTHYQYIETRYAGPGGGQPAPRGQPARRGPGPAHPRERDVLALMAKGQSNAGVATALVLSLGTVEKHVASIFGKLGLPASDTDNRRILAVLRYLAGTSRSRSSRSASPTHKKSKETLLLLADSRI